MQRYVFSTRRGSSPAQSMPWMLLSSIVALMVSLPACGPSEKEIAARITTARAEAIAGEVARAEAARIAAARVEAARVPQVAGPWTTVFLIDHGVRAFPITMTFAQNGSEVTATYAEAQTGAAPGIVQGTLSASLLTATWRDSGGLNGLLSLTFSPDGRSFSGTFTTGSGGTGTWVGVRSPGSPGS